MTKLIVVTATTNLQRAKLCIDSWGDVSIVTVCNGGTGADPLEQPAKVDATYICSDGRYLGTVPAFRKGVDLALNRGADIIACLHDDLRLDDPLWAQKVIDHFDRHPACGLAGFGGAIGLGDPEIYLKAYDPMQLARVGFRSNLQDAEVHGGRSLLAERVACLDGFSQIGRASFFRGVPQQIVVPPDGTPVVWIETPVWQHMEDLGMVHHWYDGALGAYAARLHWETWYLPIRCHHYGGQTAVGDQGYQAWAQSQVQGGDHGFWEAAHKAGYNEFRDVLPLRV